MEKTENRRVRMTRLMLRDALIELMRKKNIGEITIRELCEKADVNRSTFYKHFDTVNDLYSEILNEVIQNIFALIEAPKEDTGLYNHKDIERVLRYIEENRDIFLVLLSDASNISIGETLINKTDRYIDRESMSEFRRYYLQFVAAGMTSIVWMWLNEDNPVSAHDLSVLISMLLNNGIKKALALTKK